MIFWLSRPLDLTLVLHIVDLLGYPRRAQSFRASSAPALFTSSDNAAATFTAPLGEDFPAER
jgi:hypothetical protein